MALLHPEMVADASVSKEIDDLAFAYNNKSDYFVEKLAQGIGTIAAAFYPKPVVVRTSDFKSNEYANLIGGEYFELKENNPMIGFQGCFQVLQRTVQRGICPGVQSSKTSTRSHGA